MPGAMLIAALVAAGGPGLTSESRPLLGTVVTVTLSGAAGTAIPAAMAAAFAPFERIGEVANEWREGSPLAALNAAAGSGAWTDLPADTCDILRLALEGARLSGGTFDPTWAALRDLFRFGDGQDGKVPSEDAVARRCSLVDHRLVAVDRLADGRCRALLPRPGMQVGLGGIAKGWAVDRAAAALRALGLRDFLIQAGGDLYAAGRNRGRPWRVGVRDPRGPPDRAFAWVNLTDAAFSTSGDYERFFLQGGRRLHHIIDPRTCWPATGTRAVTVLARSAADAEVLSKGAFIRGGPAALRWVEAQGAEALVVTERNRVLVSPSLSRRLRLGRPTP